MSEVQHLVISSTLDYSTDYVCLEMRKRGMHYLRINRDQFSEYHITYDMDSGCMWVMGDAETYVVAPESLMSVYFRAPVFIRSTRVYPLERQLYRSQWGSFMRNLMVFDDARWINSPVKTYVAENKAQQMRIAKSSGLEIPRTWITNCVPEGLDVEGTYVAKALDTPLFHDGDQELFTHTVVLSGDELGRTSLVEAPVILQECLTGKIDLRVTVVGDRVFAVSVLRDGCGIEGDWRKASRESLSYVPTVLPNDVSERLLCLMKKFGLLFGGIDLAVVDGRYYFIEINPTGEWGWLVPAAGLPIHQAIVNCLEGCLESCN